MPRTTRRALPARAVLAATTALAVLTGVLAGVALPASAAPAARTFPTAIEPLARYEGPSTCDPTEKPGTVALRTLVQQTYPSVNDHGITRSCDLGGRSEHKEGRAWDWMLDAFDPVEAARAEDFLSWLLATDDKGNAHAMARRLGVMYVIWDGQVWESYDAAAGWTTYTGPVPHTDHIHLSLSWDGALQRTSFWGNDPLPTTSPSPSPSPQPTAGPTTAPAPTVAPDPLGALESVVTEGSAVRVRGWALDPDASTFTSVRLTVDGVPAESVVADVHWPSLATSHPQYSPSHGFEALVPVEAGTRTVCAIALNQNQGADLPLGCRTATSATPTSTTETSTEVTPGPVETAPSPVAEVPTVPVPPTRAVNDSCPAGAVPESAFTDLVGSVHAAAVECVVWWELTGGLTATSYGPAAPITRAQMASFLARTVLQSGGTLPSAPPDAFTDDEGSPHELTINQLAAAGIGNGKGGRSYDPAGVVTRAQMASFLAKTWAYRTGRVLPAGADYFADDDGNLHEESIGRVARAGFTGGTGPGSYGPSASTDRGQMASFLARLLDLLVEAGHAEARD